MRKNNLSTTLVNHRFKFWADHSNNPWNPPSLNNYAFLTYILLMPTELYIGKQCWKDIKLWLKDKFGNFHF